ncbi:MAG: type II toxin-antitoxin system VapC family toxin [Blastocatellia bacterium]|nr:type II toxin-antitoxin system VapC family toxin [Blastocatellia bacterium]
MRILIDTHCWLWSLTAPERLSARAQEIFADPENTIYLSAASSWEMAIKYQLGKLPLPEAPETYVPGRMLAQGIEALPIEHAHTLRVAELPAHHHDPFDRLLIAQAQIESLSLLTADPMFRKYKVDLVWAGRRSPRSRQK